jgi:hypothetical protein
VFVFQNTFDRTLKHCLVGPGMCGLKSSLLFDIASMYVSSTCFFRKMEDTSRFYVSAHTAFILLHSFSDIVDKSGK